ncbi:MAG: histone deacetylase [Pseudomonadota bacterium]
MLSAFSSAHFVLPLPAGHRFPMAKYARLHQRIAESKTIRIKTPPRATDEQLALVHSSEYIESVTTGSLSAEAQRRIGFPWSEAMVERSRRSVGATLQALRTAMVSGVSVNLAGGTHHAHHSFGSGFCVFNDAAVTARMLQQEGMIDRALIIDLDVHQGDGTATIFANDDSVFTFSMHGASNFPVRKQISDLDVELPDGMGDEGYLRRLDESLELIENCFHPDCVIYLAGADPFEGDRLGKLALSKNGLRQRDHRVLEFVRRHHLPVAITMAGGYANDIDDIVDIHYATIDLARLHNLSN